MTRPAKDEAWGTGTEALRLVAERIATLEREAQATRPASPASNGELEKLAGLGEWEPLLGAWRHP